MKDYPVAGIRSTADEWKGCIHSFLRTRTVRAVSMDTQIGHCRVTRMLRHVRSAMDKDNPRTFHGPVEVDETYIGGQRKNQKLHIRKIQVKVGRGTEKVPIVGIFDRASGSVSAEIFTDNPDGLLLEQFIKRCVTRGSSVFTDGFAAYRTLPYAGYVHAWVDHSAGEYVRGEVHTNNIEGFWGILKRKMSCIGGVRRTELALFLAEIIWRFNHRTKTLTEQEELLLKLL
jgi:transposase-like protein